MDFELNDDQRAIRETFARYVDEQVIPQADAIDQAHDFPEKHFRELGGLGFFGMRYPEEDGGSDQDLLTFCLSLEEVARGSMSLAGCVTMQSIMGTTFLHMLGNDDIKERLFKPALQGEKIGGICMTEPNAGTDLKGIRTRAKKVDGGYVLNGQKTWVTHAPVGDFFTVFAKTGEGEEAKLTIFLVERDFDGLEIGKPIEKMGVWALPTSEVSFNDCFLPDGHRLSKEEGDGEDHLRKILAAIRIVTGALAVGISQAALDESVKYAAEREQFGRPINRFQAVQMKLADMATDLEAARHLVHYAAWLYDNDKPHLNESAMAKLFASERALGICENAARIFASYGYAMEYPIQRFLRDVRFTLIGGGTSDILRLTVARGLSQ